MQKLFRKIRQKLVDEGKLNRYLIYAVGEIILVVIGILIALQINNWNIERLRIIEEKSMLTKLASSIQSNMNYLNHSVSKDQMAIHSINKLIFALDNGQPYNDSLGYHFHNSILGDASTFSTSAIETIRAKGIDLIKSDSIRDMVLDLYDMTYKRIEDNYKTDQYSFFNNEAQIYMKNFRFKDNSQAVPKDYQSLVNNFEMLSLLEWRLEIRRFSASEKVAAIEKSGKLIERINQYLKVSDEK